MLDARGRARSAIARAREELKAGLPHLAIQAMRSADADLEVAMVQRQLSSREFGALASEVELAWDEVCIAVGGLVGRKDP